MSKTNIKQQLITNAEHIQKTLEQFSYILRTLEPATYYLRENQEICRAIGVEGCETYASQLELALQKAADYGCHFSSVLEQCSSEYVQAVKNCGLPISPAFPELFDSLK